MASLMGTSSLRLQQALLSLAKGLDEIFFIALYLVVVDRLIKLIWQLASRAQRLWLGQAAAEPVAESDFDSSLLGAMRKPLKRYGWGMLALWVIDALYVISAAFDPSLVARRRNLLVAASYVVYTYVSGQALSAVKNWWLERGMLARVVVPSRGQRAIARRASGILLWTLLILMCAEGLAKTTGIHLNSILSFAGVGGIAFGLATKDLLTNLVGGCLLFVSNPFVERDKITMTNLDESRVIRVGWYQTVVRGNDEQVQTVPNAKFISNKISNRSRRTHRCMKQSFYLTYDALPFAGELIDELRATLRALPSVDATTRDFRVYLKSLTQTAIEIEIEIHFRGNSGTEFRYKRQNALLAIAQIVEKRGAKFAVLKSLLAEQDVTLMVEEGAGLPLGLRLSDGGNQSGASPSN